MLGTLLVGVIFHIVIGHKHARVFELTQFEILMILILRYSVAPPPLLLAYRTFLFLLGSPGGTCLFSLPLINQLATFWIFTSNIATKPTTRNCGLFAMQERMVILGKLHGAALFKKMIVPLVLATVGLNQFGHATDAHATLISPE